MRLGDPSCVGHSLKFCSFIPNKLRIFVPVRLAVFRPFIILFTIFYLGTSLVFLSTLSPQISSHLISHFDLHWV